MSIKVKSRSVKRWLCFSIVMAMLIQLVSVSVASAEDKQRAYIPPVKEGTAPKIFLAGDSTCEELATNMFPREGWGMEIGSFFSSKVKIVNMSKGGKSTRTFLTNWDAPAGKADSRMDDIKKQSSKGDWLFVNLGINDYNNGREGVETNPDTVSDNGDYTSYRKNLERFIDFADSEGMNIAFLTSTHLLTSFIGEQLNGDGIDSFRKAMHEVGASHGVPVLSLGEEHKKLIESLGPDHAKEIFMYVNREDYPNLPPDISVTDSTHICQTGAIEVSKIIINEIRKGAENGIESLEKLYEFVDQKKDTSPLHYEKEPEEEKPQSGVDSSVSLVPGKNNAYVLFGDEIQTNYMTFEDGLAQGITATSDPLFSEEFEVNGVKSRRVYAANVVYMNLGREYFKPGDRRFLVTITYYDFGPDVGYFYFDYNSTDDDYKRITITKPGITPKWTTVRLFIDDADFAGKMVYGADMRLCTRTYNAFAKVEIVNVDELERSNSIEDVPVVNSAQAETLSQLGLYNAKDESGNVYPLEETLSRIETLEAVITALGKGGEIASCNPTSTFTDLTPEQGKIVAMGEKLGIVEKTDNGLFNPDGDETVTGAMKYFLKYLKFDVSSGVYQTAVKYNLILNTDFVIFESYPVSRDNIVAMAYNALTMKNQETNDALIGEMLDSGKVTPDMLNDTGVPVLVAYQYYRPVKLPKKVINDEVSGRTYYYMNFDGKMALKPYVSSQHWNYDGTKFLFGCRQTNSMYEYDIVNETVKLIDHAQVDGVHLNAHVLPNNDIYYLTDGKGIWMQNWDTGEKKQKGNQQFSIMNVSNDGVWATGYYNGGTMPGTIARYNMETDELQNHLYKDFKATDPNSSGVGHPLINPGYPELLFFCNEGTATLVHDRLWVANYETGEMYNLFEQAPRDDGLTGEPAGHEVWSMTGDYMYFVKYPNSTNIGPSGLSRVDRFGKNREYFNDDYVYWHCYPSGDDRWVVGDVSSGKIVLVSTETYKSYEIANFRMINWNHPYQPHPCVSRNAASVCWQMVDENNVLGIGWADISDITSVESSLQEYEVNEDISIVSYDGTDAYTKKATYAGEECYIAPRGSSMFVRINDESVYTTEGEAKIQVTYFDYGTQPVQLKYTSAIHSKKDLANRENRNMSTAKTQNGSWKTVTYKLTDANLSNVGQHLTDFVITSPYSQVVIKDIKLVK